MSKERARRRAEREAAAARAAAAGRERERRQVEARRRKAERRAAVRRITAHLPRRAYSRRTREQRVGVIMVIVAITALALLLFDSWTTRIAIVAVTLLATPVFATAILGRSNR